MDTEFPPVPESCTQCPHLNAFHGACTHPLRQIVVRELEGERETCPLFRDVRADAMRDLEKRLE